ncbi:MAG TPA: heme ABC transporter ATP-binding protein [Bryobacterales bacterium]|nr:heme ABC transporter ATP-binding protein [Bryobacterales bacterium]
MTAVYELRDMRVRLGTAEILKGISLRFGEGEMTAIVGPNGAGKSTLMSVLSGIRENYRGSCLLRGREIREWRKRDLGRELSFIPQNVNLEFPFTAEQVVFMGRVPHCDGLFESAHDREVVYRAMETTDVRQFADRDFRALSGGERQRVIIAGALAQEPKILLLDEPTTYLDLKHQISTYVLLEKLAREGISVIAVTHDLNLAASYADRLVALSQGEVAADGSPEAVLTSELLGRVFEVDAAVRSGPSGRPWVSYQERSTAARENTASW